MNHRAHFLPLVSAFLLIEGTPQPVAAYVDRRESSAVLPR